ncbi:MAG: DNA mismatch repair protein MutS [ANME-2 cluster archaeon]|nr:DNA mismatch repair protein MutS [ANME-2 cluster archaeon]MDF1532238.1 DNA mismatch repair protein MutS [ANME-2 cluster archaeon]
MEKLTPAMRQYYDAKQQHPDALIMFRMGDFYESFGEDAATMARELDITLTTRGKDKEGEKMPLAGIPYHALDSYLPRLIKKGYKVAICEQLEDPKMAKGIVKRGVVRVVTPGTAMDSSMFPDSGSNYLMAVTRLDKQFGISFIDISTGEFITTQVNDVETFDAIVSEAARMRPAECIMPPDLYNNNILTGRLKENMKIIIHQYEADAFGPGIARHRLLDHFGATTLEGMGLEDLPAATSAAGAALAYVEETQMRGLDHIQTPQTYFENQFMVLDSITLRNLELVKNVRDGSADSSLLRVLNHTSTPMGSRLLVKWLIQPLISVRDINLRLDSVEELSHNTLLRYDLRSLLKGIRDMERLTGRIVYGNANARDLVALRTSLFALPQLKSALQGDNVRSDLLTSIQQDLNDFADLSSLLDNSIVDEPPVSLREGRIIKPGYNTQLDELNDMAAHGKEWVAKLQQQERERTGIKSLKIAYNRVFGYFIEVTRSNLSQVPDEYIRKQTTANAERFYTPELKEKEAMILSANDRRVALEYDLFIEITGLITGQASALQETAGLIGKLDVLTNLAEMAVNNNYVRPEIHDGCDILIRDGRHPVVEYSVPGGFVPNDTHMDCNNEQFLLLTGPNMAGKSTYMRQTALIVIMAQIGCFVPASYASIGIVDRVFTRVGAFDDLASGQSTFMIEMVELANILNNATPKSLILLDEIGRGTSTFDGYSIARAVVEFIHNRGRVGVRSLFATHYHQLTNLEGSLKRVRNYHIAVKEEGHDLVFLRKIVPGATDKSYGIHVARLAGVPLKVTQRAKEVLTEVESESLGRKGKRSATYTQLMLYDPGSRETPSLRPHHPVIETLKKLDVDNMTPLDALNTLSGLKKKVNEHHDNE